MQSGARRCGRARAVSVLSGSGRALQEGSKPPREAALEALLALKREEKGHEGPVEELPDQARLRREPGLGLRGRGDQAPDQGEKAPVEPGQPRRALELDRIDQPQAVSAEPPEFQAERDGGIDEMRGFLKRLWIILAVIGLLVAAFVWIHAPLRARSLAAKYARFREQSLPAHDAIDACFNQQDRLANGIRWHYGDEGNPHGTVILFLHGLPEGWYSWSKVLPLVDHAYRLIAIDMKGYGRSDRRDMDYNWHAVASQTLDLMSSLGIDKFHVVSRDWGAIIGSALVSDHPSRILGCVRMEADLIPKARGGTIAGYIQKPQWLLFQVNWIATYLMRDAGWFLDTVCGKRMLTPFQQADRDYLVHEFSRPGVVDMVPKYFLHGNWDLDSATTGLCRDTFPFPVPQLQADSDPAQPPSIFADAATQCPNVQIEWIRDASHFDNFDQPAQVADAINRFVHAANR
jgi:epoxide hydrolase 4